MLNLKEIEGAGGKLFEGDNTDPQVAVDWLRAMKSAFGYLLPTPQRKLLYLVFMLLGAANYWWDCLVELEEDPFSMGYDEFLEQFKKEFMPEPWQKQKRAEFLRV
ncbi:hypothetical protein LINGRAHAP2_LOCUS23168 [Linum grandiflorum]